MAAAAGGGDGLGEAVSKVWSYLDRLAENNPQEYKRFINKAMQERRDLLDPPRPVFCFTTGIRGKKNQKLYVNICKWTRVPTKRDSDSSLIPVKGGVLRCLVEDGRRQPNSLLLDIAFNPGFVDSCLTDSNTLDVFLKMVLDFVDEYLSILTDRHTEMLPPATKFKGPEADIYHSLDQSNPELITKESWMDFQDNLLASLKKGKKTKTAGRKGGSDTNGLPPLLPRRQSNPGNGHQATPKLIDEVEGGGGSGRNGHSSSKPQKKSKNGGKNGGQKRSNNGHSASSKNKRKQIDTVNGRSLEESGRGLEESGWGLGEVVSELRIGDRSDGGQHLEKEGTETSGVGDGEGESGRSLGESGEGRRVIPENRVTVKEEGGRDVVVVRVKLPEVTSVEQISLDSSETDISVTAADTYSLSVPFPFHVNPDLATSTFNKRSRTLAVRLPVIDHTEKGE